MKRIVMLCAVSLFLGGCAAGNKTSFDGVVDFHPNEAVQCVALRIIERRPYVLDGTKDPNYAGTLRSIGGVPYNMNTKSGKPLSVALQGLMGRSLATEKECDLHSVLIAGFGATEEKAIQDIAATGRQGLLIELNEWMHHIYMNPIFVYDLEILVIDSKGKVALRTTQKGEHEFGRGKEYKSLPMVIQKVFDDIFTDPQIVAALNGSEQKTIAVKPEQLQPTVEPVAEPATVKTKEKCTTNQILQMKEMGLSDKQISAACP